MPPMKICPLCQTRYENAVFCTKDGSRLADFPNQATSLEIGTILENRYRIVAFLGAGGMEEVYRAEHIHIFKTVAIKLLKPEITGNTEAVAQFKREALLASSIGHPAIIRIEDFGELPDGRVYMAMEYLEGEPLSNALRQPVEMVCALFWMRDVAYAIDAAHQKGIVHRDLKPENVFVARQNGRETIKILDFGIATMRTDVSLVANSNASGTSENLDAATFTREDRVFGTPYYMSPEQAMGMHVDARTDIYAMGIMLYELLSGRVPFSEGSFMSILFMQVNTPPPPLKEVAPHVPSFVQAIVHQALEKKPEQRQSSALELAQQLENAINALQQTTPSNLYQPLQNVATTPCPTNLNPLESQTDSNLNKASQKSDSDAVLLLRKSIHSVARRRTQRRLALFIAILVVISFGFVGYWYWLSTKSKSKKSHPTPTTDPPVQIASPPPPPPTFTYDCPSATSPFMGFTLATVGELQKSHRITLRLPCNNGRCRIVAAPTIAQDVLVATTTPGYVMAWKANTLEPLWQASGGGNIITSPLIWENHVVTASKDKRIRVHTLDKGQLIFESPPASEYFTANPFLFQGRVFVPAWDHSFHVLEPSSGNDFVTYFPRKIPVQGIMMHAPTRVKGTRWFFASTRILTQGRYIYTFYIPLDANTFRVQPENKIRLCLVGFNEEDMQDPRIMDQCSPNNMIVDDQPTLSAYPPLVTNAHAWFFLYGGPDTAPEGMVVVCSRTEGRCWRVLRGGTYGQPTAGHIHGQAFGVFTLYRNETCTLCGFFLDQANSAEEDNLKCHWQKELSGCPGDLRWMGNEIVFGTSTSRLMRVSAATGDILEEVRLSGRVVSAPVRCNNRLFIGTLDQSLDIFDLQE